MRCTNLDCNTDHTARWESIMRQLVTGALLTAVFFLLTPNSFLNGQDVTGPGPNALFAPETPTMWHKLGIPQGVGRIKKYRESRINRTGNKPQRESKPKLVKLTDAANLAPEGPKVLKAAAEIKMAEDLAPQKIKAIKYLATIGCGCYNKKNADMVETAILEALDDCTADVRREAINLVIKQAGGGCCSCQFNQLWLRLALRLVAGSINAPVTNCRIIDSQRACDPYYNLN